jgi:hypothetical protein
MLGSWLSDRNSHNAIRPSYRFSRGASPRGLGAAVRSVDRQIRVSLVVGRSCRRWHLGPGVEWDVPLSPGHLRRCSGRRVSPPGNDTSGTSVIRREVLEQGPDRQRAPCCCSGGLSSIRGTSESRCSHYAPAGWGRQLLQRLRHRSSLRATGLHEAGFTRRLETSPADQPGGSQNRQIHGGNRNLLESPPSPRRRNL